MKSDVYTITQDYEIEPGIFVPVLDLEVEELFLRQYNNTGDYIGQVTGVSIGQARFRFDHEEGNFQMWKTAYPDANADNRVDYWHGGATSYRYLTDESLPYLPNTGGILSGVLDMSGNAIGNLPNPAGDTEPETKGSANSKFMKLSGGSFTGDINMSSNKIENLPNPGSDGEPETKASAEEKFFKIEGGILGGDIDMNGNYIDNLGAATDPAHPVRLTDGDGRYIKKGSPSPSPVEAMQIYNQLIFRTLPYLAKDPSHAAHPVHKFFMESYVRQVMNSLNPSAYQQSGNIIRIIPSGVVETNAVYRTLSNGISSASGYATAVRNMIIEIHGGGTDTYPAVDLDFNLLPPGIATPYVHIVGKGNGIIIRVSQDTYEGTAGTNIIGNVIMDSEAEEADVTFINKIFYGVKFSNTFGSGSPVYNFEGCTFLGGCSTAVPCTFDTDCKGTVYDLVNNRPINLVTDKLLEIPTDINSSNVPTGSGWTPDTELFYGTNGALMGEPIGWLPFKMNGVNYKIPYYL